MPRSRAKEKSWRDAVVMFVTAQNCDRMIMMQVMTVAPAVDCVALKKTYTYVRDPDTLQS